jgi:hypothetical protein
LLSTTVNLNNLTTIPDYEFCVDFEGQAERGGPFIFNFWNTSYANWHSIRNSEKGYLCIIKSNSEGLPAAIYKLPE